jgi:hypothetical protein
MANQPNRPSWRRKFQSRRVTLSLICERRRNLAHSCHIVAESDGELTLNVYRQDQLTSHHLERGQTEITVA